MLALLAEHVDGPGLNPASGGHLGYIPGGGLYAVVPRRTTSSDVTNRYAGVFFSSPGAVRVEHQVMRWTADVVGFPASAGGTLTSGGSIANLACLAAARDSRGLRARDFDRVVVYLSSQTHHCVAKALRVLGLSECEKRYVPLDDRFRMRPDALEAQVEVDRRAGLKPWLVVASAGTTDVGALDPLDAIADVAAKHGLWYHVDAAYGGYFRLIPAMRERFRGIERADSAVLDPHKTLFLPYGLGVALVRDAETLLTAFKSDAPYLQDTHLERDELSPADLSPELTRHFRGLRLWLPLLVHGIGAFRASLEEKLLLDGVAAGRAGPAGLGNGTGARPLDHHVPVGTGGRVPRRNRPDQCAHRRPGEAGRAGVRELHDDRRALHHPVRRPDPPDPLVDRQDPRRGAPAIRERRLNGNCLPRAPPTWYAPRHDSLGTSAVDGQWHRVHAAAGDAA